MIRLLAEQIKTIDGEYINGIQVSADVELLDIHGYQINIGSFTNPIVLSDWNSMQLSWNEPIVTAGGKLTQSTHKTRIPNYGVDHDGIPHTEKLFKIFFTGANPTFAMSGSLLLGPRAEDWKTAQWINNLVYSQTLDIKEEPEILKPIPTKPPEDMELPFWKTIIHSGTGIKDISGVTLKNVGLPIVTSHGNVALDGLNNSIINAAEVIR